MKRPNHTPMIMSADRMPGKTVAITGVGRGLGRAMAREFAAQGHRVAGCSRNSTTLETLRGELGDGHLLLEADVSDDLAMQQWADAVVEAVGAPELLLNNAAVINPSGALWELDAAVFDQVIDINIKGVANVIRHFTRPMMDAGGGIIVNFSSGWGRSTSPEVAPYCATKWAVEGLTQSLAQELPAGLAAIPLNPGVINTDMLQSCFGPSAIDFPPADDWAKIAVPFILNLEQSDNGRPMTVG